MKKYTAVLLLLLVLGGGIYFFLFRENSSLVDYKDATYIIEEKPIALVNGVHEEKLSDSSSKVVTRYFGNLAKGDVNDDGIVDLAFLLTVDSGGSGTFFYVVAALQNAAGGYEGTNAIFLGDRIAPQTTEIRDGRIIVNYAERKAGEPFITLPSVGVSKYLTVSGRTLQEIFPR